MAKLGQIVAKSDPNLANLDLAGLSCPWNPLVLIQNPSNSIIRTSVGLYGSTDIAKSRILQERGKTIEG